jgi:hypothetical protein
MYSFFSFSLFENDQWELERRENYQLVQLTRVRYELMIRLIFTLLGKRNEYIIIPKTKS